MSGDAHGHGGGSGTVGKIAGWVAVAGFGLIVLNGFFNRIENKPLLSGIVGDTSGWRGVTGGAALRGATGGQSTKWTPSVDCGKIGGTRTINPNTGRPTCYVP